MSDATWLAVCEPEGAASLSIEEFSTRLQRDRASPIDDYYRYVEHLLTLGRSEALERSATLGRLLLLGLVSGVESYFRSILAGVLRICPVCRRCAADHPLAFGSIDYYGADNMELGLFDAASFAGASEVHKKTSKLLGIEMARGSSVEAALQEFDKVCHLRHAAVHARGTLGRGNALALSLDERHTLRLNLAALHQAGAVSHSVVRAYNRFIYKRILERWTASGMMRGEWSADKRLFQPLFDLFCSREDAVAPRNAYTAYRAFRSSAIL